MLHYNKLYFLVISLRFRETAIRSELFKAVPIYYQVAELNDSGVLAVLVSRSTAKPSLPSIIRRFIN
jgi:hypothetical protein